MDLNTTKFTGHKFCRSLHVQAFYPSAGASLKPPGELDNVLNDTINI